MRLFLSWWLQTGAVLDVRDREVPNLNERVGRCTLPRVKTARSTAGTRVVRQVVEVRHPHLRQGEVEGRVDQLRPGDAAGDSKRVVLLNHGDRYVHDQPERTFRGGCRHAKHPLGADGQVAVSNELLRPV